MSQTCPYCAEPLEAGPDKCPHCGESLLKGAPCKLHPGDLVTGACPDCGQYVCPSCHDPQSGLCLRCGDEGSEGVSAAAHYEIGAILGVVFKDPEWLGKVLTGAACLFGSFLIVPVFALWGYRLRIIRQQRQRPGRQVLPRWDNFGELVGDGFRLWVTMLLPGLVVIGPVLLLIGVFVGLIAASEGQGSLAAIGAIGLILGYLLVILLVLALGYFMPAIEMEYLDTGNVSSGLNARAIWRRVSSDPFDYLVLFLYHYLIQQVLGMVGVALCFVGMYASVPWALFTDGVCLGRYLAAQDEKKKAATKDGWYPA